MKILLCSMLIICCSALHAQEINIHETPKGFFILLGKEIPYEFNYRISRKEGKQDYKILGETHLPVSREEYQNQLSYFQKLFSKLPKPNKNQVSLIWTKISQSKNIDSLRLLSPIIENLALGLAWQDTTAEKGKAYQYKIEKLINDNAVSSHFSAENEYNPTIRLDLPMATFYKNERVNDVLHAQWIVRNVGGLVGFDVYRQDNLKGGYQRLNVPIGFTQNLDTTYIHLKDTTARKFEVYEYKLRPFDMFENPGTFSEVAKINNFTKHDLPVLRKFKAVALDDRQISIVWNMDYKPFIQSIKILRSREFDTGFDEVGEVSAMDSTFTDVVPVSMENYYYRLVLNAVGGISFPTSSTFVLYKSERVPDRIQSLEALTSNGGVELKWEDHQPNVFGYYVFRKYKDEDFRQVSEPVEFDETGRYTFLDTARQLKGNRFYQYVVQTVSDSYVTSSFSDTVSARPDIVVNVKAPQHLNARKADDKVYLVWDDQSKMDEHLSGYQLLRKKSFENEFKVLNDTLLSNITNHYIDTTIEKGFAYQYVAKAFNYFGGESEMSNQVQVAFYLATPIPPAGIKAQSSGEAILVTWGDVLLPDLNAFLIYKYKPGEKPERIGTVSSDQHHFMDDQVTKGELYFYYVTSQNSAEIEGQPSAAVAARY